ncbi:MAG: aldolase [Deltaproteobacteria bacterium]|nr:aldolase [Deltaproteobacteria bacterium]
MQENKLNQTLNSGKTVIGPFLKLSDPTVVEIAGLAGFDFVIIDMEHGPHSIETAQNLVRAAEVRGITPIIRVTENNPGLILRALDIGAQGVQVPQVSKMADVKKTVEAAKFYPTGNRGVCRFVRAADYSLTDRFEYFRKANRETTVIVHIEGVEGMNNLPQILTVPGLDVVFLGPYDLSQSCGVPGEVDHPKVIEKMKQAIEIAKKENIVVGTFVDTVETGKKWMSLGVQYISFSVDAGIFYQACSDIVKQLKTS